MQSESPKPETALAGYMRQSEMEPFLLAGPPAPKRGWIYRDFRPMPRDLWIALLDLLGDGNVAFVAASASQLPPNAMCRAQIWISPEAQRAWKSYLGARQ